MIAKSSLHTNQAGRLAASAPQHLMCQAHLRQCKEPKEIFGRRRLGLNIRNVALQVMRGPASVTGCACSRPGLIQHQTLTLAIPPRLHRLVRSLEKRRIHDVAVYEVERTTLGADVSMTPDPRVVYDGDFSRTAALSWALTFSGQAVSRELARRACLATARHEVPPRDRTPPLTRRPIQ